MEFILRSIHRAGAFGWLYAANLFFGFHFFAVHYIDSSFLEEIVGEQHVGLVYGAASLLAAGVLLCVPYILSIAGYYRMLLYATVLDLIACLGLAFLTDPGLRVVSFALLTLLVPVILFALDVYLENKNTSKEDVGNVRGIFLSMGTLASLLAPLLAGYIAGDDALYSRVYLASGLFLMPFLAILVTELRDVADPPYHLLSPVRMFAAVRRNKNVWHIGAAQFLMRFFFAWMVVYLPIYLHENIGFTWPDIGLVLFIMLVPYLLVEWPAGLIADRWLGEQELLIAGFAITAVSTAALVFITTPSLLLWGGVLFVTRIGTALIESMTETYFFKKVDGDDTDLMSFFRVLRPLAYAAGPVLATLVLAFTTLQYLWVVLGAIMLLGIVHARALEDTK